jgi:hypothetical protein
MPCHETITAINYPLVAEKTGRRPAPPELLRDPNPDRQSRYSQGFDADWFLPATVAPKWMSYHYPREATVESVQQWITYIDYLRTWYFGLFGRPEMAAELETKKQHDLELIRQHCPHLARPASPARHSSDFRHVHWFGTDHTFTATQAACVKILWNEWENGTPEIGQATILEHPEVESESKRLVDVFKGHPAWGTMIVKGATSGAHRLAEPPQNL